MIYLNKVMGCLPLLVPVIGLIYLCPFIIGLVYGANNSSVENRTARYLFRSGVTAIILLIIAGFITGLCFLFPFNFNQLMQTIKPIQILKSTFPPFLMMFLLSFVGMYFGLLIKNLGKKFNKTSKQVI